MQGVVVKFDRDRGYGFIRTQEISQDLFVHIRSVRDRQYLVPGQRVDFEMEETNKGLAAVQVIPGKKRVSPYVLYGGISIFLTLAMMIYMVLKGCNLWIGYFLSINLCTLLIYGYDKLIAKTSILRVPEWILHGVAIGGGSPAALLSQKIYHHKTIKRSFQLAYWTIVLFQIALILAILLF